MSDIKRLGSTVNAVVVQLPERQHPGIVIQHDSLVNLLSLTQEAKQQIHKNDWDEVKDVIGEIEEIILGYANAFQE